MVELSSKLPTEAIPSVREKLLVLDDEKFDEVKALPLKNPITMCVISWLVGFFGIDHFMLGQIGMGIFKLLTCGWAVIGYYVDIFLTYGNTKKYNLKKIQEYLK